MCIAVYDHKTQKTYYTMDEIWNGGILFPVEYLDADYDSRTCFCWGIDLEQGLKYLGIPYEVSEVGDIDIYP